MRKRSRDFLAFYLIDKEKISFWDDNDITIGMYPKPTYIIRDIDVNQLVEALGIRRVENLPMALKRLPAAENDVIRVKNLCEEKDIPYTFIIDE